MIINDVNIDGLRFTNIGGEVKIRIHDVPEIKIICIHENKLHIQEQDGILEFIYNKEETETVKKNFVEKIFKKSFKLNLPFHSSFVEDRSEITIYHLLMTEIEIFMPYELVEIIYLDGNMTLDVDSISDALRIYSNGNNVIKAEKIKNVFVESQGKIECLFQDVLNSSFYIIGDGFVKLNGKPLHSIRLKTKGNIDLDVVGSCFDLNFDLNGISNVIIFGKVQNKRIKKKGICKISIVN